MIPRDTCSAMERSVQILPTGIEIKAVDAFGQRMDLCAYRALIAAIRPKLL